MVRILKPTAGRRPLVTIRLYKRHVLAIFIVLALSIAAYVAYFHYYMVLPQSSVNILQEIPFSLEGERIMVISPHCDDEVLGAGGLIQRALSEGSVVHVVMVTDCNRRRVGHIRLKETMAGLEAVGVKNESISFLMFPEADAWLTKENQKGQVLSEALKQEIDRFDPTVLIVPHPEDTHKDHAVTGKTVDSILLSDNRNVTVAYYLIHYNFMRFPSPQGLYPDAYLLPPARLITFTDRWYKLSLFDEEEDVKQEAVLKYKSQLRLKNPILTRILLDFVRRNELFMMREA